MQLTQPNETNMPTTEPATVSQALVPPSFGSTGFCSEGTPEMSAKSGPSCPFSRVAESFPLIVSEGEAIFDIPLVADVREYVM